jgi:hypothetical protein
MSARPGPSGGYHAEWYPYRDLEQPTMIFYLAIFQSRVFVALAHEDCIGS